MKLWFAGNFPQMKNPELEKSMMQLVLKRAPEYNRLLSFFFTGDAENVINIRIEDENGIQTKKENDEF
jgi:hypothetical protein